MNIRKESDIKRLMGLTINKILVDGFCNLENVMIDIDDLVAFVSTNNYGKSNVLTALRFGFDFLTSDSDHLRNSMMRYSLAVPICVNLPRHKFTFGIEGNIQDTQSNSTYSVKYYYSFDWTGKNERNITNEILQIKDLSSAKPRYRDYIVRQDNINEAKYLKTSSGRCGTKLKLKQGELAIRKLLAYDDLFYNKTLTRLTAISVQVEEHFDAKPEAGSMFPFILNNAPEISFENIGNLPRYLYHLERDCSDEYSRLIDSFKQLIPDVENVEPVKLAAEKTIKKKVTTVFLESNKDITSGNEVNPEDDDPFVLDDSVYQLYIHYRHLNQPIEIKRMSDGTCRVLTLLAAAVNAQIQKISLMCFEELENCIHPRLFRDLLNIISQLAGDCKVIFTSHSPYMVRFISLDKLYIGIPNDEGKGLFNLLSTKGQKAVMKEAEELEMSTGEYIFDALAGDEDALEVISSNTQVGVW